MKKSLQIFSDIGKGMPLGSNLEGTYSVKRQLEEAFV